MKKYRKKPIVIEAMQYTGENRHQCDLFCDRKCGKRSDGRFFVETLEGFLIVSPGDWIIRGIKGEFYPCKPDIFEATYEEVV